MGGDRGLPTEPGSPTWSTNGREIIARRGKGAQHIATVATARHLMKVVYYTMRDGHARCLDSPTPAPELSRPDDAVRARS